MVGFLSLLIRLAGIVLMAAFCVQAMSPLRSLELNLFNVATGAETPAIAATEVSASGGSSLLSLGLAAVAIISIWLIYQTWQQHISLANGDLRNRRTAKNIRL